MSFTTGDYYHLYNRGTEKRIIFQDSHDYKRFLALLYLCNNSEAVDIRNHFHKGRTFVDLFKTERIETLVDIGAYCLMPNHFHVLVYEKQNGGVSVFMKKLCTAYSMYFNKKYERTGGLFEGRFKAKHIDNEPYFNWLFSYIHLNPAKIINSNWKDARDFNSEEMKSFLSGYSYSSYSDYFVEQRLESVVLNKDAFPAHFKQLNDVGDLISGFKDYFVNEKSF